MNNTPLGVRLKLGTKLMLLIGAALTSLVIIGAVAVIGLNRIAEDSRKLNEEGLAELTFIGDLQISIERMSSLVMTAPKETDNRKLEAGKEQFQNIASQLEGRIAGMQEASAQADGDHAEELGQILEALRGYVEHSIHVYRMSGDGDWYGADKMMTEQTIPAKQQLDALAAGYISGVNRDSQAFVSRMKAEIRRMTNLALAAAIGLIIAVGGGGLYIVTTSMRAINAIASVTGRLAVGDMEVQIPGGERADEIGEMARSLEHMRTVGLRAARAQSSLDDASSAMTIIDLDGSVIFSNKAMTVLAERLADDISRELPGFAAPSLTGETFDRLHNIDAMTTGALAKSDAQTVARMVAAGYTIELTAGPVFNDEGARLGTVVEWQDMTGQVAVEREIASIVHAASEGDFSQRLAEADKNGFMAELAKGINELLDVIDHGLDQVVKIMSALAEGDLTKRMRGEHKGAFARLKQDADRMGQQMEEMVGRIANVSGVVKTATDEISAGISNLSIRTDHQASSLEETTASMEELSATVRQNADNAQEANQVASAAREAAVSGG
ncbi:MAG TPA: HAMP domain-containing protein, partial [Afifellaceae bacterium]|nr:HAMP domain-containing protein [Afifellaceae bacterium]